MNITLVKHTFKAGSIQMEKQYTLFKRIWAKLKGKQLPYNKFELFVTDTTMYTLENTYEKFTVVSPKKAYSNKEAKALVALVGSSEPSDVTMTAEDILIAINTIRPNTVNNLNELIESKFYTVTQW